MPQQHKFIAEAGCKRFPRVGLVHCMGEATVARRPNPKRKQELLDGIVHYLAENGLGELSLRPLANALGTSTYTLTYQFGSKEDLIVDTLNHVEERHREALATSFVEGECNPGAAFRRYWAWLSDSEHGRLTRIVLEATTMGMAGALGYSEFRHELVTSWRDGWRSNLEGQLADRNQLEQTVTLTTATLTGLTFDLLATNDTDRVTGAAMAFADSLEQLVLTAQNR